MNHQIVLKDAFKYTIDQDKILPPGETVLRLREKLKKIDLDILECAVRIDNGRLDIPVFFSKCGKDAMNVTGTRKYMGKGATVQQAEASAMMELAERYSLFSFLENPDNFFVETYRNLKEKAISFDMIAQSVHDDSDDREIAEKIFENIPIKWALGHNLTRDKEVFIPFNWFFTINQFNGSSAGNCEEEALLQGICEVVERHVSSIISQNRLKVPKIKTDKAANETVISMIQKYQSEGIKFYFSDFSLDMGIPTVGILAYDPLTFPKKSEIVWTAGTTTSPEKSLSRALTEAAQLAGDFNSGSNYLASGLPKLKTLKEAEYVISSEEQIDIDCLPDLSDKNIKVEIENCINALAKQKMEVLAVDIKHPLLEVPAFYTMIPGAFFRERAAGGVGMFASKLVFENKKPYEAVKDLDKIENMLPGKYYIKFYLGSSFLAMGDPETALKYFIQSLDCSPLQQDTVSIYSYIGICLKDMGKYHKALEALKKGEKLDNERTDIYNLKGFCYFKLKEYEKAIENFKKVLQLDPGSAIDYANIGSNYKEMGKNRKAVKYYELALQLDPSIDFALKNLIKLKKEFFIQAQK